MTIDPAILRALVASGATAEMIIAAVEADKAIEDARKEAKRANNRERQARHQAKKKGEKAAAANADNALVALDNADNSKGGNGSPKEYIQTPSLPPKGSDADASGAAPTPPTAKQILWSKGKALLVDRSGMSKAQAGDLIGKWVGQWGVETVLAKVEAAESEAENPKLWIAKALGREPKLAHAAEPNETTLTDWAAARFPRMRPDERLSWAREVLKPLAVLPAEAVTKGIRDGLAEKPRFINEVADLVASKAREWARLDARAPAKPKPPAPPPAEAGVTAEQMTSLRQSIGKLGEQMRAA